jgi:c-di-GMP-binding flagellar brake protein YcgR
MNLPSELYQEITESITVVSRDQPREADRRAPRMKLSSHLNIACWEDPNAPLSVRIRDLSQGGIGLFHTQRIALDQQLVIRLPRKNCDDVLVLGTVVYWEPLSENLFGIGVQFDRLMHDSEIEQQSDQAVRQLSHQVGIVARFTQAVARTWRVAS